MSPTPEHPNSRASIKPEVWGAHRPPRPTGQIAPRRPQCGRLGRSLRCTPCTRGVAMRLIRVQKNKVSQPPPQLHPTPSQPSLPLTHNVDKAAYPPRQGQRGNGHPRGDGVENKSGFALQRKTGHLARTAFFSRCSSANPMKAC